MYVPYSPEPQYRRRRRSGCGSSCLMILIIMLIVGGSVVWLGRLSIDSFVHTGGGISIPVANTPMLLINNDARSNSELFKHDAAPIHIHAGSINDNVLIRATNIPLFGISAISYRQSEDHTILFISIDYNYKGSIDITVPAHSNITLASYENGIDIDGVTGKFVLKSYKGSLHIAHSTLSGPSLLQSYQGAISADTVTLKYASSFKSYQGDVTFHGSLAPEGDHFFYTYAGAVTLMLPKASAFTVDASDYQNEISSDFPGLQASKGSLQGSTGQSPHSHLHLFTYKSTIKIQSEV